MNPQLMQQQLQQAEQKADSMMRWAAVYQCLSIGVGVTLGILLAAGVLAVVWRITHADSPETRYGKRRSAR